MSWRTSSGRLSNWSEWLPNRSSSIALFFSCVVQFIFLWFQSRFFMWENALAKNPRQGTFTSSSWQHDHQLVKFGGLSDHTGFQVLPHMVSGNFLWSTLQWSLAESISLSCRYRFLHVGEIINFAVDRPSMGSETEPIMWGHHSRSPRHRTITDSSSPRNLAIWWAILSDYA